MGCPDSPSTRHLFDSSTTPTARPGAEMQCLVNLVTVVVPGHSKETFCSLSAMVLFQAQLSSNVDPELPNQALHLETLGNSMPTHCKNWLALQNHVPPVVGVESKIGTL